MTNPTLERAARAARAEVDKLRKSRVEIYPGKFVEGLAWANLDEVAEAVARAVLMAVRSPDEVMKTAWLNAEMHGTESAWFLHRHRAMIDAILNENNDG